MNIPLNIDWQQIVLHLMNFAILAGGLYFLLYNPVKKFMAKRAEYYENMDKEANEKLESAPIKEAEYQKHMEELEAELDAKRKEAAKQADAMIQQSVNQAKEQAAKVMSDAKAAAMQERTKILDGAEQEIVQMAMDATEKILADNAYEQFLNAAERSTKDAN